MNRCLMVSALTIGLLAPVRYAGAQALTPAQLALKAKVEGVPEIPYEAVPNFLKLPDDLYFGESVGVATNSKGHTFVYDRGHQTRIFEFDQTGKFINTSSAPTPTTPEIWRMAKSTRWSLMGKLSGSSGQRGSLSRNSGRHMNSIAAARTSWL